MRFYGKNDELRNVYAFVVVVVCFGFMMIMMMMKMMKWWRGVCCYGGNHRSHTYTNIVNAININGLTMQFVIIHNIDIHIEIGMAAV